MEPDSNRLNESVMARVAAFSWFSDALRCDFSDALRCDADTCCAVRHE